MRRTALLGLLALLPGCQYVADPTAGAGRFFYDTHTLNWHPTQPPAVTQNERLVAGLPVTEEPLLPEKGEVWPGPPAAIPTLQDVQKLNNLETLPPPDVPTGPPALVFPQNAPTTQ